MSISLFDSARTIYEAALRAVKPDRLVREKISRDGSRLIVEGEAIETVGAGASICWPSARPRRPWPGLFLKFLEISCGTGSSSACPERILI